jgi:hypothetical protein
MRQMQRSFDLGLPRWPSKPTSGLPGPKRAGPSLAQDDSCRSNSVVLGCRLGYVLSPDEVATWLRDGEGAVLRAARGCVTLLGYLGEGS